ncbi:phage tail protein [Pectobacterium zantedeschiae]|uniref:Phage tail protein n=1 Tax=Pectobacterium zantedeschiae TaxID=2034769 RepID=A0A9X8JGX1_9GAMM|nr:phage tail protein [Pectobacterium zantedeschiae]RYC38882.1 hypothetical protein CLR69_21770 [Pectobacterium zantedeschiae]
MSATYFALLTNIGAAKLANATALGSRLNITQMAVGDGGGVLPTPNPAQTALINEQRRAALNTLSVDPKNPSQIIAEQVIPENEGGWWVREVGLFDDDGNLIAVANCPETYKPLLQQGSGRIQTVRMILIVSSTDAVTLKIDPAVVLATRSYVDNAVIEVKAYADNVMRLHLAAADPHPQYAPKASPALTGKPTAPTATQASNDTQLATTAFVKAAIAALVNGSPGALDTLQELAAALGNDPAFSATILNAIAEAKADAANKLNAHASAADPHTQYAPKVSPVLTGTPTAPTAGAAANDTQIATTAFVKAAVAALVNGSPAALDTLQELANALGNDPNFSTTVLNALAGKLAKDQNGADIPDKPLFREHIGLTLPLSQGNGGAGTIKGAVQNVGTSYKPASFPDYLEYLTRSQSMGSVREMSGNGRWRCHISVRHRGGNANGEDFFDHEYYGFALVEEDMTSPAYDFSLYKQNNGKWLDPVKLYHTGFKPTAADVGAYTKAETDQSLSALLSLLGTRTLTEADYVRIPDKPGGLIIQWMTGPICSDERTEYPAISFPVVFPSKCLFAGVFTKGNDTIQSDQIFQVSQWTNTNIKVFPQWFGTGTQGLAYPLIFAIGQ